MMLMKMFRVLLSSTLLLTSAVGQYLNVAVVIPENGVLTVNEVNKNKSNVFQCTGKRDEVAINQAIRYLNTSNGGTLYLEYGFYNIQSRIVLASNVSVIGLPKSSVNKGLSGRKLLKNNNNNNKCDKVRGECCASGCPSSSCVANGLGTNSINCNKKTCGLQVCNRVAGCSWTDGSKCLGKVSCIGKFDCQYKGDDCFYDGSSDNFKICTSTKVSSCEKSSALSTEGGHLVRNGVTKLDIAILPHTASFTNILQLYTFNKETKQLVLINERIASNKEDVGKRIPITLIDVDSEIVFAIRVVNTGQTWFMGPNTRNKDNLTHAVVTKKSNTMFSVSFEDLTGEVPVRNFDDFTIDVNTTFGTVDMYVQCEKGFDKVAKSVDSLVCKQENSKEFENKCEFKLENEFPLLKYTTSQNGTTVMFQTINRTNISIKNINLEGVSTENVLQSGLYFRFCKNIKIEDVSMFSFSRAGLRVEQTDNVEVTRSRFACNNYYGIEVVNTTRSSFDDACVIQDNRYGFKIHNNNVMSIVNNVVVNNMYTFDMRNDTLLTIQDNVYG